MIAFFSFVIQNALLVSVFPQAPLAVDRMDFACAVRDDTRIYCLLMIPPRLVYISTTLMILTDYVLVPRAWYLRTW